ncbi:pyridoxamine 5'-phosphate oxidase family protein [Rhizobacter sp. Root404]|uniref:pyridoxamine 5'-phosphate oxidase family protein n=1 Tax=Rhizobacter sp. Root404 TaxID=1736528 RepID=UPI0006FF2CEF|nr:pyridoxamine 5'-phosphate oxidase family protein [Rhizobacter sp. Root404]KQW38268.1 pyridoxamine 5'-phosphate oxidase [Rhizobacter sp. Root404]
MDAGPRLASLPEIERALWQQLEAAVTERSHPWRTPVLATVAGDAADARTVILREVSTAERQLVVYTDERAGKVAQIAARPHGTLVMWSNALRWQLRCRVRLSVETDGLGVTSRWARLQHTAAAQDYLAPHAPGAPVPAGTGVAAAAQRAFFAVVAAEIESIDWLELHADGHRRARFDSVGGRWLQP